MVRKCTREKYLAGSLGIRAPQLYCPVCSLLEAHAGENARKHWLLPKLTKLEFANRLRIVARRLGREQAERLGAHGIRRGAARTILASGGTFAHLRMAGQ